MRLGSWISLICMWCGCAGTGDSALEHTTDDGLYLLHLTPTPDPFEAAYVAELGIHVSHEDASVEGCVVTVEPWMPEHGHGISDDVAVTEMAGGMYEASWSYSMPGHWELAIDVHCAQGDDSITVGYDVL